MKKYITCILLIILSFIFGTLDVHAVSGIAGFDGGAYSTGITWHETGDATGKSGAYTDHKKHLLINGQKFVAYCLDPGLSLNTGDKYTCTPVSDPGLLSLVGSGGDYTQLQMALRFYAVFKGYGSSELTNMRAAMVRFAQIKDGVQMTQHCEMAKQLGMITHTCSGNLYDYLSGNNGLVDAGYNLAWSARETSKKQTGGSGGLTFTKTAASTKDQITYQVTSLQNIDKVKFVCEGCSIVGSDTMTGNSGTLVVRPAPNCEPFTIKAYYVPKGVQICSNSNSSIESARQYLVVNFDMTAETSPGGDIDTSGEPNDIHVDRGIDCDPDCCTEKKLEPNHIEGEVYNCCIDSPVSWAKEYELNDLVCYSKEMLVDHYWKMCNSESYLDKKMNGDLNEYCDIYCTERVTVEIPGAITATSGRYFDLTTTSQGKKSPYVEGFKRCRTLIHFKKWQDDYRKQVEEQVKQYNLYQKSRLYELTYEDALNKTRACNLKIKVTCVGETKNDDKGEIKDANGNVTQKSCSATANSTGFNGEYEYETDYTEYQFTNPAHNKKYWHTVMLKKEGWKEDANGYYNYYKIIKDGEEQVNHRDLSFWETLPTIEEAKKKKSTEEQHKVTTTDGSCSATAGVTCGLAYDDSCGHNSESEHSNFQENVVSVHAMHKAAAAAAKGAYQAAVANAKTLEEKLDICDDYFTTGNGTDAKGNFPFNASLFGFEYTQVYLTDFGDLKKEVTMVPFDSSPGCVISGPTLGPDAEDGLVEPQYSTKYHSDDITESEDFGETNIEWEETETGFEKYIHELYEADQKFVQDAKYHAVCFWNEPENTKYTLVQKGVVQESDFNMTKNDRQYHVHLSTLEGSYDTRWLLSGLGTNSKFDAFFAENGATCSTKQNATDDGLFHCALKVTYEIIETGKCNGEKTTISEEECDRPDNTESVLNFKIVDPATVFTCNSTDECGYGYNWFDMPGGPDVLSAIRRKGQDNNTYAPENLTYSVTLTSKDMKQIKNYNRWRENDNYGGYSDFSLLCDCPSEPEECNEVAGTQTCKRSESCVKCKSIFLNNLYDGVVNYGGNHSVTRAHGNIENIRSNGHVHWAG